MRAVPAAARVAAAWLAAAVLALPAAAGPVERTLDDTRHCPRDQADGGAPLTAGEAVSRALVLLPDGYCGPSRAVDGCDADAEHVDGSFRVYVHQYRLRDGRRDWSRLAHTYVILDRAGNCLAHIPGTDLFGRQ